MATFPPHSAGTSDPVAAGDPFYLHAEVESSPRSRADEMPAWPAYFRGQREEPVNVMVVDDDPHIRNVIVQDLLSDLRIQVVGQAASFREARRMIPLLAFDVLLVDLNLGDGSGFELIAQAVALRPGVEAVVVSGLDDEHRVLQAFSMGATGFLVKSSWFGNFSQAVLQVVNGGAPITPQLARRLLSRLESTHVAAPGPETAPEQGRLSRREKEILKNVSIGLTSAEVGERMHISVQTVNSHIKNIYRKLQVHSRTQAINHAHLHALI